MRIFTSHGRVVLEPRAMRTFSALVAVFVVGCSASRQTQPRAAPEALESQTATPEPDTERAAPTEALDKPVSPEALSRARSLILEGRSIQQERGEGGAAEAIKRYLAALELDPKASDAYWELGWSYQVLDELDDAFAVWEHLKALDPDYPELDIHFPILKMRREQKAKLDSLPDPGVLPEPELEPYPGAAIHFAAVGDVQTGRAWPPHKAVLPPNDADGYFDNVKEWLRDADMTFGNLEEVLLDDGDSSKCGPKSTKCFAFRVPTSHAELFADAGFDLMSIANNHAGDFGLEGRAATMRALDEVGIVYSGPVDVLASYEVRGLRVGMVAFSTGGGTYRIQDIDTARRVVADLDRTHDIVVVSFHGGAEGVEANHVPKTTERFYGENRGNVYAFAHAMVDTGADLILGHGPHVLRGVEIYKGRLIAYSLGNFSSYKTFGLSKNLGWSTVLHVDLAPNGVALAAKINPVILKDPGRPRRDKQARAIKEIRRLSREDFGDALFDHEGEWRLKEPGADRVARSLAHDGIASSTR